jgi:HAD superfamily hydrolase (TIGR01509 family)
MDGQVSNVGGALTGGSVSKSAGLFTRKSEISALKNKLENLKTEYVQLDKNRLSAQDAMDKINSQIEGCDGEISNYTSEKVTAEIEYARLSQVWTQYLNTVENLENDIENFTHIIERNLRNTHTDPYFKTVVSGKDVKHGKPAPDIFLYAAEKIGFDPKDCYVFEDGFNGIEAAYAAGCAPIMIPDQFQPTDEIRAMCVGVYDTLLDAKEAFEKGEL